MPLSDWTRVRGMPLFAAMAESNFAVLREAAVIHRPPKNAVILKEGERPRFLFLLVEGSVELFGTHDSQAATIEVCEPVAALMLAAVIRDRPNLESARSISPARVLAIPAELVRAVFRGDAAFPRGGRTDGGEP